MILIDAQACSRDFTVLTYSIDQMFGNDIVFYHVKNQVLQITKRQTPLALD